MERITPEQSKKLLQDILNDLPDNTNIKRGVNNAEQALDPRWKEKQKQGIQKKTKTKTWKQNQLKGIKTIRANGSWKQNVKKGATKRERENKFDRKALNTKLSKSENWLKAIKKGMKDRWEKPKNLSTCIHCGKTCDNANYKKWHGDNCKKSPLYVG